MMSFTSQSLVWMAAHFNETFSHTCNPTPYFSAWAKEQRRSYWYDRGHENSLFIRPLTKNERSQIQAGVRTKDTFVLQRSQVLLVSDRGERATDNTRVASRAGTRFL